MLSYKIIMRCEATVREREGNIKGNVKYPKLIFCRIFIVVIMCPYRLF
jgi:hypothetical protein